MTSHHFFLQCLTFMNSELGFKVNPITPNCSVFNSGTSILSSNRVVHNAIPKDSEVTIIKAYFADLPFTWVVDLEDTETQKVLEENGLIFLGDYPAMVLDLNSVSQSNYGDGIEVKTIDVQNHELDAWCSIVEQAFLMPRTEICQMMHSMQEQVTPGALTLYLAYYQGKAQSAGYMLNHSDVVSLHWISTVPEYRNKGLGYAVTHKILLDAQQLGCKQAILLSSRKGRPVYERLGFKEYCLYKIYGNAQCAH